MCSLRFGNHNPNKDIELFQYSSRKFPHATFQLILPHKTIVLTSVTID